MWDKESLRRLAKERLSNYLFIVVSNREPYIHSFVDDEIKCEAAIGGLATALDPILRATAGIWIAHGNGDADRAAANSQNKVMVPPEEPLYTLKRVWLSEEEINNYYYGFSNQALWPLCHAVDIKPIFDKSQWDTYRKVNEIFARSVLEEIRARKALVFVQDYHLALLPRLIKEASPETVVAHFWHIPWPRQKVFQSCPWREEILNGLLGNDLLGFHTVRHCRNFLTTVNRTIPESKVNYRKAEIGMEGKTTTVCSFPISVDFEQLSKEAQSAEVKEEIERLKGKLNLSDKLVGVSIDRLDYTKGIPQRLMAVDRFLEKWPEYKRKVAFIQVVTPTRTEVPDYRKLTENIKALEEEINQKHGGEDWKPIITMLGPVSTTTLAALRGMASLCIVNPLHDGMNLVAKEFISSRYDNDGVLLLSYLAGAAKELKDAVLINPYAVDRLASSIKETLEMPRIERYRRMRRKRSIVRENNIYKWAADIILELAELLQLQP
jgi:trehalose 6-phosphate synthase